MTNKRGRPPLDRADPSVDVHVRVPAQYYDRLYAAARTKNLSVPELVRQVLRTTTQRAADHEDR